ncbi:hypothetical protein, partial [Deinococcus apachensis]|uniref:hypothetical protein n=1 Tax=Deinococcus apachensis TaxID=309886 RepID=UPI001B7FAA5C
MRPAPRLVRTLAPATLVLGILLGLAACGERGAAQPDVADPYAGGVSYPWSDQVQSNSADPYAGGVSYPWSGPGA